MKHDWKVGETYKDHGGREYKFVAIVPEVAPSQRLVFAGAASKNICTRYEDGTANYSGYSSYNIIPPKRYVYVNIFNSSIVGAHASGFATEDEAARQRNYFSGFVRMEKIEV